MEIGKTAILVHFLKVTTYSHRSRKGRVGEPLPPPPPKVLVGGPGEMGSHAGYCDTNEYALSWLCMLHLAVRLSLLLVKLQYTNYVHSAVWVSRPHFLAELKRTWQLRG